MPKKCTATGSERQLPRQSRFSGALRCTVAVLICLTALDTSATPARPQSRLATPTVTQLTTGISAVTITAVQPPLGTLETVSPQPVKHALRAVSALVARASQESKTVAVRLTTVIGFRG